MKFLVQLMLAFFAGLVIGHALLEWWAMLGGVDPFSARYGRW